MRRSISRSPGSGTSSLVAIVLMYGVVEVNGSRTPDLAGPGPQRLEQAQRAALIGLGQHVVERFNPLARFHGLDGRGIGLRETLHV